MIYQILILTAGLGMVLKGGDWFVDSSVQIAKFLRVPRILVGATIVSIGTTLPELTVSSMASFMKDSGIAYGNTAGTVIANTGLVVGLVMFLTPVSVEVRDFRTRSFFMMGLACLAIFFGCDQIINRFEGWILCLFAAAYFLANYFHAVSIRENAEGKADPDVPASLRQPLIRFLLGAALVLGGSRLMVTSGSALAAALGIPSVIIGLTIIAVGASLPELVTAIISSRKGVPDLSIGNIAGANILNLSMITGTAAVIHPLTLTEFTQAYAFPCLFVFVSLMTIFLFKGRAGRKQGLVLLFLYGAYVTGLISASFFMRNI